MHTATGVAAFCCFFGQALQQNGNSRINTGQGFHGAVVLQKAQHRVLDGLLMYLHKLG